MPWRDLRPMDEKILFIGEHLRGLYSHSELCERYGISRKTGYKWICRYQAQQLEGLQERSRRPLHSPEAIPYTLRKAIIELRQQGRDAPGAKKIQAQLSARFPAERVPSKSTIYNILRAAGLTEPRRRRRRVSPYPQPFGPVHKPNELWSADYKGQFRLGNAQWCYPLTVMDHHSRYLLGCRGEQATDTASAQRYLRRLFREHGLPRRIRSDNGAPFASTAAAGLSRLSIWWIRLGIVPERIEAGKPQQNGRHERMHRTLKQATARPASANRRAQQRLFDQFRDHYNHHRPHEALGQEVPARHYCDSPRPYPERLPQLLYPGHVQVKVVSHSGVVYAHGGQIYLSHLLAGERVGLEEIDDGVWEIHFGPLRLGAVDLREKQGGKTPYWTLRL
ncbi:integrase core domain-containing protein [Thioalkalivibrio thiocyanodenitrificans]|uniref:integrase core domain-containing protein n=1 Tax=Thioalkalivibrio thiocyanodenitrificans TaxID=243063 RepID=UPI00047824ED